MCYIIFWRSQRRQIDNLLLGLPLNSPDNRFLTVGTSSTLLNSPQSPQLPAKSPNCISNKTTAENIKHRFATRPEPKPQSAPTHNHPLIHPRNQHTHNLQRGERKWPRRWNTLCQIAWIVDECFAALVGPTSKSHQSPSPRERLFRAQWEPELSRFLDHFTFLLCIARRIETAVPKPLSHKMNTSPWARIKLHYHTLVRRALSLRKCAKNATRFVQNEWLRCSGTRIWWDCCACEESRGFLRVFCKCMLTQIWRCILDALYKKLCMKRYGKCVVHSFNYLCTMRLIRRWKIDGFWLYQKFIRGSRISQLLLTESVHYSYNGRSI